MCHGTIRLSPLGRGGKAELSTFVSGGVGEGQLLEAAALLVGDLVEQWWPPVDDDEEAMDGEPIETGDAGG